MKTANGSYLINSEGAFIVVSYTAQQGPTRKEVHWAGRMSSSKRVVSRPKTKPRFSDRFKKRK